MWWERLAILGLCGTKLLWVAYKNEAQISFILLLRYYKLYIKAARLNYQNVVWLSTLSDATNVICFIMLKYKRWWANELLWDSFTNKLTEWKIEVTLYQILHLIATQEMWLKKHAIQEIMYLTSCASQDNKLSFICFYLNNQPVDAKDCFSVQVLVHSSITDPI